MDMNEKNVGEFSAENTQSIDELNSFTMPEGSVE